MARDGIHIHFRGGDKLDRALSQIQQRIGTKIINQSLSAGATQVKKSIKAVTPVTNLGDTKGFKLDSRNTTVGQLKKSIASGLRKKVNTGRDVFLAGVWFQNKRGGASEDSDGFFAKQVIERHAPNAFGYKGGNNFLQKGVKAGESKFRNKVGSSLANKLAAHHQSIINANLK